MLSQSSTGKLELFWPGCLFGNALCCWHGVMPTPPQRCSEVVTYSLNPSNYSQTCTTSLVSVNQNQFAFSSWINEGRKGRMRWVAEDEHILLWCLLLLISSAQIQTWGSEQVHINVAFVCISILQLYAQIFKEMTEISKWQFSRRQLLSFALKLN